MKKIVFFIQNMSRAAGSERVTSIIASELAKRGYSVSILSICGDNNCFFPLESSVRLYTLFKREELDNKKHFFQVLKRLNYVYGKIKPDVVIDVFAALSIYSVILKKKNGFKNITWEHFNYKINVGMNRLGRQLAVRFSDQIITLTKTDMEYYKKNNKIHGRIDYIYNPSPFQNVELNDNEERKKIIISVGRLTYQKGFDRLIKVWEKVEPKCDWELMIIGDGEDRQKLQKQIDEAGLKNIELVGTVKNIEDYYRTASLYVSTSRFEGLPMTMIEAHSFGMPIISFDYDTGPYDIVQNGLDGYVIERGKEEQMISEMSEIIIECIADEKRLAKLEIQPQIRANRFEIELIIGKWINILNGL